MTNLRRRLQKLEEKTAIHEVRPPWVQALGERQRRRAEANGVPYEPWHDPTLRKTATWSQVLQSCQRHRAALRAAEESERQAQ